MRGSILRIGVEALAVILLIAGTGWAQQASGIAGVARDTSGAVLPGVAVEVSGPALLAVRMTITDEQGRYNIVDLPPGTYTVTFTLSGFATFKSEGIPLTAGFTATVNAAMEVGGLEQTVTVTGEAPLVDTANVREQLLISNEELAILPTNTKSQNTLVGLTPGFSGVSDVAGSYSVAIGGGTARFHGKNGTSLQVNGMVAQHGILTGYLINGPALQEMTIQTSGISAETTADGAVLNMVPKQGGNTFSGSLYGLYTNTNLQSDNLTNELRSRGLTTVNKNLRIYDYYLTLGGPIKKDRLWFYTVQREWGNANSIAGLYWNKTQGTPFYTPDLSRPADRYQWFRSNAFRISWQVSPRNQLNFFSDFQHGCVCRSSSALGTAPEAAYQWHFVGPWEGLHQVNWSAPVSNKLLLEAGFGAVITTFPSDYSPGVSPNDISITEQSTGFVYNAKTTYLPKSANPRYTERFTVSYVTGSHNIKAGFQDDQSSSTGTTTVNGNVNYAFNLGKPVQITQYATPYSTESRIKADMGIFVQDQWHIQRFSLNYGLRFDYFNGYIPAQHVAPTPTGWIPARNYAPISRVPLWTDLSPRLGVAYDLTGDGRTAIKASFGQYVAASTGISVNPINTSVNTVTRTWTNTAGDYIPHCDLGNFAANGECGSISNLAFGTLNIVTRYADDVSHGFNARAHNRDFSSEIQRQLSRSMSVTGGYYRSSYGNFTVTRNLAVNPSDYTSYCITAPKDPNLPKGGGYQICGLADINPSKFGQVNNLVEQASRFGHRTQVNNFFDVSINARFPSGAIFFGGFDTGRTVSDSCFIVNSPQDLLNCHIVTPFGNQTQIKMNGSYPLPAGFVVGAVFQNTSGPPADVIYAASNSEISSSLGRNLAACGTRNPCNATATVPLTVPGTMFEGRTTRLDLRVTKILKIKERTRVQANLDLYNALNASSIISDYPGGAFNAGVNGATTISYGPTWRRPTDILEGRIVQFSSQVSF